MTDNNPYEPEAVEEEQHTSNLTLLTNVLTSPAKGMSQVKERYSVALPMLTVTLLTGFAMYYYYTIVDYAWLVDYIVETTAGDLSKAEQDQTRAGMNMMPQEVMGIVSGISMMIVIPIFYIIHAVYFLIVSNITNDGYGFKQWLSFVSWTSIPGIFIAIAMFVFLLTSSNGQISPESINPLSLNELFFNLEAHQGLGKMLAQLHLATFWTIAIMILGYQEWTKKSMGTSVAVVLIPFILIYGIWFLLI